jgi:mycothiol synthase
MTKLLMRRPDLLNLPPLPALPDGYALQEMQMKDIAAVSAVLDRAFTDEAWDAVRVAATLNKEQGVKQTLVVDFRGRPVATASARLQPDRFPGSGYLHWVAVDPDHRGQRLGFFLSLAVLHTFGTLGCTDAFLETQDHRLAAIQTYLKLGFLPEYRDKTHQERWATITKATVKH